jgi:tetratricopeptide (TPR) repeat protein
VEDLESCPFEEGQKLLEHIENLIENSHELLSNDSELGGVSVDATTTFARYCCHFEKYDESEATYKKIIEVYDRDLQALDMTKLGILHDLAFRLREAGKLSEAEVVFEKVIEGKIATVWK